MKQSGLGSGPQTLRMMNCAAVLRAIRERDWVRTREIMDITGLSRPTVTAAVGQLIEDGWVEESDAVETEPRRMGRPARLLRFRAEARVLVGTDIGPNKVDCAVADLNGRILARLRRDADSRMDAARRLELTAEVVAAALERAGAGAQTPATIGVGTPGIVDAPDATVVRAPSLPGFDALPIGALLRRRFECPVRVDNDVNLAVLAEQAAGTAARADTLVLAHWGARLGGAVLVHGRLLRGARGAAGEIGFVDVTETPAQPDPAGLGPLEARCGTARIHTRARELGCAADDPRATLRAAAAGDAAAVGAVEEACAEFARALAPFLAAFDPHLVVLGGSITLAGDTVGALLHRSLLRRTLVVPPMEVSRLGDDAVALGAVRLAQEHAEKLMLDGYAPKQ